MEADWLANVLDKFDKQKSITKVLSIKSEPAVGKAENFTSVLTRLKTELQLGSGKLTSKNFILKGRIPTSLVPDEVTKKQLENIFLTELEFYKNEVPVYEEVLCRHPNLGERLWPKCYHADPNSMLLEDLKEDGYRLADRKTGLDLPHAKFLLTELGRFHGIGKAAVEKGLLKADNMSPNQFLLAGQASETVLVNSLLKLSKVMKKEWPQKWAKPAEKLEKLAETVTADLCKLNESGDNVIKVPCHGDTWVNNFMFKYRNGASIPSALVFIDFQLSHYGYYSWDLVYFLYTSLLYDTRELHLNELLSSYCDSLSMTLKELNCPNIKSPTVEEAKQEVRRMSLWGLVASTSIFPLVVNPSLPVDLNNMLEGDGESLKLLTNPLFVDTFQKNFNDFIHYQII